MASLGHVAVGLAAARLFAGPAAPRRVRARSALALSTLSLLPDADVLGFAWGIRYADPWGHRGASHSIAFALALAALGALAAAVDRRDGLSARRVALATALVVGSHGLLDALTDGGLGVATLWPFSTQRYFAPWQPIPVAPIGRGMFSAEGAHVLWFEALWFSPLWAYGLFPFMKKERNYQGGSGVGGP
ncbi:MAG: metal-dependent hydrolase [Polyangiaceae bacterium]|jgi:inner membrane protein|nr:metal-dependent hydrolase [Polyangiaceae bacterium]